MPDKLSRATAGMIVPTLRNILTQGGVSQVRGEQVDIGSPCHLQRHTAPDCDLILQEKQQALATRLYITPADFPNGDDFMISQRHLLISLVRGAFVFSYEI